MLPTTLVPDVPFILSFMKSESHLVVAANFISMM